MSFSSFSRSRCRPIRFSSFFYGGHRFPENSPTTTKQLKSPKKRNDTEITLFLAQTVVRLVSSHFQRFREGGGGLVIVTSSVWTRVTTLTWHRWEFHYRLAGCVRTDEVSIDCVNWNQKIRPIPKIQFKDFDDFVFLFKWMNWSLLNFLLNLGHP